MYLLFYVGLAILCSNESIHTAHAVSTFNLFRWRRRKYGKSHDEVSDCRFYREEGGPEEEGCGPDPRGPGCAGVQGSEELLHAPRSRQARAREPQGPHGPESSD